MGVDGSYRPVRPVSAIPDITQDKAFVAENVYPFLFDVSNMTVLGRLSALICTLFFRIMSIDFDATFLGELNYVRNVDPRDDLSLLSYRAMLRELKLEEELFEEICYCRPLDLLRLQRDPRIRAAIDDAGRGR